MRLFKKNLQFNQKRPSVIIVWLKAANLSFRTQIATNIIVRYVYYLRQQTIFGLVNECKKITIWPPITETTKSDLMLPILGNVTSDLFY